MQHVIDWKSFEELLVGYMLLGLIVHSDLIIVVVNEWLCLMWTMLVLNIENQKKQVRMNDFNSQGRISLNESGWVVMRIWERRWSTINWKWY